MVDIRGNVIAMDNWNRYPIMCSLLGFLNFCLVPFVFRGAHLIVWWPLRWNLGLEDQWYAGIIRAH